MLNSNYVLKVFASTVGFFLFFLFLTTQHVLFVMLYSLLLSTLFWLEMDFSIINRIYAGVMHLYADIHKENEKNGKKKTKA